ncbi:MAG: GntR family transcriptional regulator [Thermovirga sp.]|nr:GntR family transcriptional regulator [Thermovirga sp.]
MANNPFTPAKNMDLREIVYQKIKEAIVEGLIKPGERLSEVDIADKLAVSRTPVREAIRQLAQTGLVTLEPRKGAFVTLPTLKDAEDLYDLRTTLEVMAIRYVTKNPPVETLKMYRKIFAAINEKTEPKYYLAEDRKFHNMLCEASGNKYLHIMLSNISDLINLCRHYSVEGTPLTTFAYEHILIIDAILDQDLERAEKEMRAHLNRTKEGLLSYLRKHPDVKEK